MNLTPPRGANAILLHKRERLDVMFGFGARWSKSFVVTRMPHHHIMIINIVATIVIINIINNKFDLPNGALQYVRYD